MYCAVNEAFDNSLKEQINKSDNNFKRMSNKTIRNTSFPANSFDNYDTLDVNKNNDDIDGIIGQGIIQYPQFAQTYFTAQGDLTEDKKETLISDLKKKTDDNASSESLFSDDMSDLKTKDTLTSMIDETVKLNHDFCVNAFINNLNADSTSLDSGSSKLYNDVYGHIKKCKICKRKINEKISSDKIKESFDQNYNNTDVSKYISPNYLGYDVKEILLIFLAGIILIFLLDLLVRIGKKTKGL